MRRVLVSLVLGVSLAVIGAASAFAGNQFLPDQACNPGTTWAGLTSGNLVVPALMPNDGPCMNMPTLHP
jgi:hypothetical protein